MVATVTVEEANGSSASFTEKSVGSPARFCTTDDPDPGETYPCTIPPPDLTYYSYWKQLCLNLQASFYLINNVRVYTDGSLAWTLGTGGRVVIGKRDVSTYGHGCPQANYQQAAGIGSRTGYAIKDAANGHAYYKGQITALASLFSFTSVAPCNVDLTDHTSAERTKFIVIQAEIQDDATQGDKSDETVTFMYDEV